MQRNQGSDRNQGEFVPLRFPKSKHVNQAMLREYQRCLDVYLEAMREVRIMRLNFGEATSFEPGELTFCRLFRKERVEFVVEASRFDDDDSSPGATIIGLFDEDDTSCSEN